MNTAILKKCILMAFLLLIGMKSFSQDTIKPIIVLNPGSNTPIELDCGNGFYIDPGATAIDDRAPFNLTTAIITTSNVNTRRPGTYQVTYSVQDVAGNKTTMTRTVVVAPTKNRGFIMQKVSNDLELYITDFGLGISRTSYQWVVDGEKIWPVVNSNKPDSIYVFLDNGKSRSVKMEEWFCNTDTSLFFELKPVPSHFRSINGIISKDLNGNCEPDSNDGVVDLLVNLYDESDRLIRTVNSQNGRFSFNFLDSGKYKVKPFHLWSKLHICDPKEAVIITDSVSNDGFMFSVRCDSLGISDPRINSISAGLLFPGREFVLNPYITSDLYPKQMNCYNSFSKGKISLDVVGKVKFIKVKNGAKTPVSIAGNHFEYEVTNFEQLHFGDFDLVFKTDTNATVTDTLKIKIRLYDLDKDFDSTNNIKIVEIPVRNSYDPNLVEMEPSIVKPGYDGNITHSIHFQNTGNAMAFNIRVRDTLDSKLDVSTFEFLHASHPVKYSLSANGAMNFFFPDIMLMDSFTDEEASHGLIVFRIKPKKGLNKTEILNNTAHIYFDYNDAVTTNTAEVVVVETKNSNLFELSTTNVLSVYPNPGSGKITISFDKAEESQQCEIFTSLGVKVDAFELHEGKAVYDASKLSNGMYLIRTVLNGRYVFTWMMVGEG